MSEALLVLSEIACECG